jgi:NarL family two-component system response regulator LiaR
MPIKIITVDDHALMRDGIKAGVEKQDDMEIVAESGSPDAIQHLLKRHRPQILFLDLLMRYQDGRRFRPTHTIRRIRRDFPKAKIVVISAHLDISIVESLFENEIGGYLLKEDVQQEDIAQIVRDVHRGKIVTSPSLQTFLQNYYQNTPKPHITERQRDILTFIAHNLNGDTQDYARALNIQPQSLQNHLRQISQELGTTNRTSSVLKAIALGLIPAPTYKSIVGESAFDLEKQ